MTLMGMMAQEAYAVVRNRKNSGGFSLLELVIVVVIVGIIAAVAIPRMSRGTAGAADNALSSDLAVMRRAIELYATEHGGSLPGATTIGDQLTKYTNSTGNVNATKTSEYIYGPYMRSIPPLPTGAKKGCTGIAAASADGIGWIYNAATGALRANCTSGEVDAAGKKYMDY